MIDMDWMKFVVVRCICQWIMINHFCMSIPHICISVCVCMYPHILRTTPRKLAIFGSDLSAPRGWYRLPPANTRRSYWMGPCVGWWSPPWRHNYHVGLVVYTIAMVNSWNLWNAARRIEGTKEMESLHDMSFISRPFNDIQLRMVIFYQKNPKLTILMKNLMISDEHAKPWDFEVPMGSLKRQPEPASCYRGAAKKDSCLATRGGAQRERWWSCWWSVRSSNATLYWKWPIELVVLPIQNGWIFPIAMLVYQRVSMIILPNPFVVFRKRINLNRTLSLLGC